MPVPVLPRRQFLADMLAATAAAGMAMSGRAAAQSSGRNQVRQEPWQTLPPTPQLPAPRRSGLIAANGASLYYAQFGRGSGVLLLHGGMGSSNYWGHLIAALSPAYAVTALDTRGHGRSPLAALGYSYKVLADDAAAALAALDVPSAAVVGWSDGAIAALQMAISHPTRVTRAFLFGGNVTLDGYKPNGSRAPVFAAYTRRCRAEYQALSPHPEQWPTLVRRLAPMWRRDPGITAAHLAGLRIPVTVALGQHDEIIRTEHAASMARAIPGAKLRILPGVSHFAMLQRPHEFNQAVQEFLAA